MSRFDNKQTGLLSGSDLKTVKGKIIYWVFFASLIVVCFISLFPKDMSPATLWNRFYTAWDELKLGDSFLNTIYYSVGSLVLTIVVCGFGGYVLSKLKPKGSRFVFMLVVWTMMMPGQIRMVPNYISMLHFPFAYDIGGVNLLNTFWPMWLPAAANAFNIVLFKNAFDSLSNTYVEAAKLDGCTNFGVFFRIMLPLSMPIIIYVSIGALSGAWSDFFGPLLYLSGIPTTPLRVYNLQSDTSVQMNTKFMGLVLSSIPPFLIFLVFQKHILGGINIGGVKG